MTGTSLAHVVALVPVRSLCGAKSRLGEPLDAEERADLVRGPAPPDGRRQPWRQPALAGVLVVSMDGDLLAAGPGHGRRLAAPGGGRSERGPGRRRGCAAGAGATAVLVLPADLPGVTASAIDALVEAAEGGTTRGPGGPIVALVPDHHGTGTNALLVSPPDAIRVLLRRGQPGRPRGRGASRPARRTWRSTGRSRFDLDTPEDLLEADLAGLDHEAGR